MPPPPPPPAIPFGILTGGSFIMLPLPLPLRLMEGHIIKHSRVRIPKGIMSMNTPPPCKREQLCYIGMFKSLKCDVNPQPNTRDIGLLVGRSNGYHRSVVHVLAVISSITYHFSFICQYIFIQVTKKCIWSGREICPLLMYPSKFPI